MNNEHIKHLALINGFKLKEQPDGSMDLNPYVYDFANALLGEWYPHTQLPINSSKVLCVRPPRFDGDTDTHWIDWCERFVFQKEYHTEDDYTPERSAWTWHGEARHCKEFKWRYLWD